MYKSKHIQSTKKFFFLFAQIAFIFHLFTSSNLYSHTIILKDLNIVYGIVYRQDSDSVYLNSDKGQKKIPKDKIGKILVQDIKEESKLKKLVQKVKNEIKPASQIEKKSEIISSEINDIEIENAKFILAEIEKEEKEVLYYDSLFRSAIVPGWGQYHSGNKNLSYIYGGTFFLSFVSIFITSFEASKAKNEYIDTSREVSESAILFNTNVNKTLSFYHYLYASEKVNESYERKNQKIENQKIAISVTIGIYFFQLIHLYFFGYPKVESAIEKESKLGLKYDLTQNWEPAVNAFETKAKLGYTWNF